MENALNERIKQLRESLNLSQNDFASKIGLSSVAVWKMETGDSAPRKTTLKSIVNTFGVSEDWLVSGVGELEINIPVSNSVSSQSWSEKAFETIKKHNEHLEQEVKFLRDMLSNVTSKMSSANFNDAFGLVGVLKRNTTESVRAVA